MELAAVATVLAAIGGLFKLLFDYLNKRDEQQERRDKERDERFVTALADNRAKVETFLGNHMSKNTAAMQSVESALRHLAEKVEVHDGGGHEHS